MSKVLFLSLPVSSLLLIGLMASGNPIGDPPCFQIATSATKDCMVRSEQICTEQPATLQLTSEQICNGSWYHSPPNPVPKDFINAASGSVHEGTENCWYKRKCVWKAQLALPLTGRCHEDANATKTWTQAAKLRDNSTNNPCNDPDWKISPAL
jgi:hypothetical protein